jgi:hypothetical protein
MQFIDEKVKELRDLRRRCGWYGMRRDFAMQRQLANECYKLHVEIENSKRAAARIARDSNITIVIRPPHTDSCKSG